VERARRQFDAVEPENRLVAATLESRWKLRWSASPIGTGKTHLAIALAVEATRRRRVLFTRAADLVQKPDRDATSGGLPHSSKRYQPDFRVFGQQTGLFRHGSVSGRQRKPVPPSAPSYL